MVTNFLNKAARFVGLTERQDRWSTGPENFNDLSTGMQYLLFLILAGAAMLIFTFGWLVIMLVMIAPLVPAVFAIAFGAPYLALLLYKRFK